MPTPEICFLSATELIRLVRAKALSVREMVESHLARIERLNPQVNAVVTLTAEQAIATSASCSSPTPLRGPRATASAVRRWRGEPIR